MNKDYRLSIKIRNNNILVAIESAGYVCGQKLASLIGIQYQRELLGYVNLTFSPIDDEGNLLESAVKLCEFLKKMPYELWSNEQLTPVEKNTSDIELSFDDISAFMPAYEDDALNKIEKQELKNSVDGLIGNLTPREAKIIRMRFGFGCDPMTLQEVGDQLGVTGTRIRDIEQRCFRKLRHESRGANEIFNEYFMDQV
jgi:RNA polymerase primary sigma factor